MMKTIKLHVQEYAVKIDHQSNYLEFKQEDIHRFLRTMIEFNELGGDLIEAGAFKHDDGESLHQTINDLMRLGSSLISVAERLDAVNNGRPNDDEKHFNFSD